jgi:hypothetical protein
LFSGFSQPRQCGDDVLRIFVTGGPPNFSGGGVPSASPTGGDKGIGTLNLAGTIYSNGVAVSGTGTGTVTSVACGTGLSSGTDHRDWSICQSPATCSAPTWP